MRGLALLGFSAVGACIGVARFGAVLARHRWTVVGIGLIALLIAPLFFGRDLVAASVLATPEQWDAGRASWLPQSVALAWLGQFIIGGAAIALWAIPKVGDAMALVGRHTLSIYLAHIIVIAGLRIVLVRLGFDSVPVLMVLLVAAGVIIPLAVERLVRATPLRYVFDTPPGLLRVVGAVERRDGSRI